MDENKSWSHRSSVENQFAFLDVKAEEAKTRTFSEIVVKFER